MTLLNTSFQVANQLTGKAQSTPKGNQMAMMIRSWIHFRGHQVTMLRGKDLQV